MVFAVLAVRWVLALILLGAGVAKLRDRRRFAVAIERYRMIPERLVLPVARGLPLLEIAVGLALAVGLAPTIGGLCATLLFLVFATAVGVNLVRGRRFECGCGGAPRARIGWSLLVRDLVLAALGAAVAIGPGGLELAPGPLAGPPTEVAGSELLPVPLMVVAAVGLLRCVQSFAAGRLSHSEDVIRGMLS